MQQSSLSSHLVYILAPLLKLSKPGNTPESCDTVSAAGGKKNTKQLNQHHKNDDQSMMPIVLCVQFKIFFVQRFL